MIGIASYLVSSPRRILGVLVVSAAIVGIVQIAPLFTGTSGTSGGVPGVQGVSAQQTTVPDATTVPLYATLFDSPRVVPDKPVRLVQAITDPEADGSPIFSQPAEPSGDIGDPIPGELEVSVPGEQETILLLRPTFSWVNVFGDTVTLNGDPVQEGDVVTAFDPDGTLVGRTTVVSAGRFGLMALYQDDPETSVDEGADPGDEISFEINGMPAVAMGPHAPIWTANGSIMMSNLAAAG